MAQEVWGTELPQSFSDAKPRYVVWGGSLPEAETVCRHWLQIWTAETIKI